MGRSMPMLSSAHAHESTSVENLSMIVVHDDHRDSMLSESDRMLTPHNSTTEPAIAVLEDMIDNLIGTTTSGSSTATVGTPDETRAEIVPRTSAEPVQEPTIPLSSASTTSSATSLPSTSRTSVQANHSRIQNTSPDLDPSPEPSSNTNRARSVANSVLPTVVRCLLVICLTLS